MLNHPTETTIKNWLFGVPGTCHCFFLGPSFFVCGKRVFDLKAIGTERSNKNSRSAFFGVFVVSKRRLGQKTDAPWGFFLGWQEK